MRDGADERERRLAEREQALADARAALRAERAEVERLLAEATDANSQATAAHTRARKLAIRFVRRVRKRHTAESRALAAERQRLAEQVSHLNAARTEFHVNAASTRERLSATWATLQTQQKRSAAEWAEANQYIGEQVAALDTRVAELDRREKATADHLAIVEAETAGLREEAATLEQRVQNAHVALADLEQRRDRARAELLQIDLPSEIVGGVNPDDLAHRELLVNREKGAVAALRSALELESADLNDHRRVVAEQLAQLSQARGQWQRVERQTVVELEEFARGLANREHLLDAREARLIRADARRREDTHDLWRLRLRLESWQTQLTAFELRWHTEREQLEANLRDRLNAVALREAIEARSVQTRESLAKAVEEFARQHAALVAEVATHAARSLAAEELISEAMQDAGTNRTARRLAVLRKRWEQILDRQVKAVEHRHRELRELLTPPTDLVTASDATAKEALTARLNHASATSEELTALCAEVERLAASVLDIEFPSLPDQDATTRMVEEPTSREPMPFGDARAA